jgi:hypothetical protein
LQRPHCWPLSQYVAQRVKILLTKQQGQKQRETEMASCGRFRRRPTNGRWTARPTNPADLRRYCWRSPGLTGNAADRSVSSKGYSLATCIGAEWVNTPAPETCDATRNATMTAGTLISLRT